MQVHMVNHMLTVTISRNQGDMTIEEFMARKLFLPEGFIQKHISGGQVMMQGKALAFGDVLKPGQKIWFKSDGLKNGQANGFREDTNSFPLCSVLYEDDHILAVNKPPNLLVHSDGRAGIDCLDGRVEAYFSETNQNARALHVHRLDMGTTGVVLYSKHGYIARALDDELRNRHIKRTYLAVTYGQRLPAKGEFTGAIGRDRHISGKYRVSNTGKEALTEYKRITSLPADGKMLSVVACRLKTGRTHQIRVHFSHFGAPIVGDVLYGGANMPPFVQKSIGIGLHAFCVEFYHPYEERVITVHSPLPTYWDKFLQQNELRLPSNGFIYID